MTDEKYNIGPVIRDLRKRKKLRQKHLEEAAGMKSGNMSRIESGDQKPSDERLNAIARRLGVSVSEIYKLAEEWSETREPDPIYHTGIPSFQAAPVVGKIVFENGVTMLKEVFDGQMIGVLSDEPEVKCYLEDSDRYGPVIRPVITSPSKSTCRSNLWTTR